MARIKLHMPDEYIFSTKISVRIGDINYGNHLGNDALLSLIHESRVRFLESIGYSEKNIEGIGIIMSDAAIEYKGEVYYGDSLTFEIAVADISRKSCDLIYRISNAAGKIIAHAKTGIVFFNYHTKKAGGNTACISFKN